MPSILIRNLSFETIESLKATAKRNGRSLQAEVAALLEDAAAAQSRDDRLSAYMALTRAATRGRPQTDSADLIREDRDSDHGRDLP
jgi:plasmid stability protein